MLKQNSLYMLNETITNGFQSATLNFVAITAIISAILVIVSKNPIVSVLFLIGLFLSISIYLMLLGINFIGLSYLLVYVGAVSILFLFILMLINIRISEIVTTTSNSIPLAIFIGILFFSTIYQALPLPRFTQENIVSNYVINKQNKPSSYQYNVITEENRFQDYYSLFIPKSSNLNTSTNFSGLTEINSMNNQSLEFVSSQSWDAMLAETSHISTLGNILYTSFPLWLLLTSLILLLSMVGAILITLKN